MPKAEKVERPTMYRLNGGEAVTMDEMPWGILTPFDIVECRTPGTGWNETIPARPYSVSADPAMQSRKGPDGRYRLDGPVWPPTAF